MTKQEGDMAETTELEKQAAVYERRLKEAREEQEHQLMRAMHLQEKRLEEAAARHKEQAEELRAQGDGMLGALGRVTRENEELRAKSADFEKHLQVLKSEFGARLLEAEAKAKEGAKENDRVRAECRRVVEESSVKMQDLERQLHEAKAAKKTK